MSRFLTVFIPAYNEEKNLPGCIEALNKKILEVGIDAEILIVDDQSQDKTGILADQIAASNPIVRVIHHPKNGGIGAGFLTARANAQGEWLILIPADLAMEPNELVHYLEKAPNADIVVGLRSDHSDYTLTRRIVSFINIHLIQFLFGIKIRQFQYISMYRLKTLQELDIEYAQSAFFHAEILVKAQAIGKRLVEVEIKYIPRLTGRATGAKIRLIFLTVRDIFHFWLKWVWLGPEKASKRHPA
jgi:glycosyltransferase involved in cell wall biosynthesis